MNKKILTMIGVILMSASCSRGGKAYDVVKELNDSESTFTTNLLYQNPAVGIEDAADPDVIYHDGYYYLYPTTNIMRTAAYGVYRSKDLATWELLERPAYMPARDNWSVNGLWAPDIVEIAGKFYLFYTGAYINDNSKRTIGVAVSDHPAGPFVEYKDKDGNNLKYDFGYNIIDAEVLVDEGRVYFYFTREWPTNEVRPNYWESSIDVVELSADLREVLTEPTILINPTQIWETKPRVSVVEAPHVLKHNGKYYLTYSGNGYTDTGYAVGLAISDSPTGPFVKTPNDNRILYTEQEQEYVSGTGHHAFVKGPDNQLYAVYHSHKTPTSPSAARIIGFDRAYITDDNILVDGPSLEYSLLPDHVTGYTNVALNKKVVATNTEEGKDPQTITDGVRLYHYIDNETTLWRNSGKNGRITIDLEEDKEIKAVLVYTSIEANERLNMAEVTVGKNKNYVTFANNYMGFAMLEFPEVVKANKVVVYVEKTASFGISEIVVLGK